MIANFLAANGFRRRSYDDQEGDNDVTIILQSNDLRHIEKQLETALVQPVSEQVAADEHWPALDRYANRRKSDTNKQLRLICKPFQAGQLATSASKAAEAHYDFKLAKSLLDQDYSLTVRLFIRNSALNWNFNSFTFDALCCGRSLTELLLHLFDYYDLYNVFNLDMINVLKFSRLLEFGYHSTNPYHNSIHAADVTQAMHCFMQENKIKKHMTHLETMCSILAAVCHDLDHPGVNQSFLVATNNPLAHLYNNNSVLENHHWRFALSILRESNLLDHLSEDIFDDMKKQLENLILATDIARQNEYLTSFRNLTSSDQFDMQNTEDRALVLQMALKCADLCNSCRPWLISRVWSNLICDEFYKMGRIERKLGIPLTPIFQREKTSIASMQADFFKFIVLPLLELWNKFLESPLSSLLMSNFDHNYQRWQRASRIVQQLRRRKSVACIEPVYSDIENDDQLSSNVFSATTDTPTINQATPASASTSRKQSNKSSKKHSFSGIKRASSDYVKSGNFRVELLRNFQLDRIIERSPMMAARLSSENDQNGKLRLGKRYPISSDLKSSDEESTDQLRPSNSELNSNPILIFNNPQILKSN